MSAVSSVIRSALNASRSDWSKLCQPSALPGLDDFLEGAVLRFAVKQRLARAQAAAHDLGHEQSSAAYFARPVAGSTT